MKKNTSSLSLPAVALAVAALAGCDRTGDLFCAEAGCSWSSQDWAAAESIAGLGDTPPLDRSNKYAGNAAVELLGQKFFFDTRWSGPSSQVDVLKRPVAYARAAKGQPTNLSCASCHNLSRAGIDTESLPGNVSIGAAWSDANALSVMNAAFYKIQYWNGRADSLWAQAVNSAEGTNMNGNRLATTWVMSEIYRQEYTAAFGAEYPLPSLPPRAQIEALVETAAGPKNGQCKLVGGACPVDLGCREVRNMETNATACFPRFPLNGKPGARTGCQPDDGNEPNWDAFDCMDEKDQEVVSRTLINYAKAIAAYEYKLVSRDSAFDRFVAGMRAGAKRDYDTFSASAERGARLFVGKAACVDCHNTPLLSDSKFYNIGVSQVGPGVPSEADCPAGGVCDCVTVNGERTGNNCLPWGALDGIEKLGRNKFRRDLRWSDDTTDTSHMAYVNMELGQHLKGAYRTPSLRDAALTPPYMHNGALATLEAVVDHYDRGGSPDVPGVRHSRIKPLFLTAAEKSDLVAFLKSLTGAPLPPSLLVPPK
jgi:cytochrome c peroxidase